MKKNLSVQRNNKTNGTYIKLKNNLDFMHIKYSIRKAARRFEEYHEEVLIEGKENLQVRNTDKNSLDIPFINVNTLGRVLFGVPNFKGCYKQRFIKVENDGSEQVLFISYPKWANELMDKSFANLEERGKIVIIKREGADILSDIDSLPTTSYRRKIDPKTGGTSWYEFPKGGLL